MSAGKIILWRHGQTDYNLAKRIQGTSDIPLNDEGIEQARRVAPYIASMNPTRIISSPLVRARRTAEIAAQACGCAVETYPELTERRFGAFEGLTREELLAKYPDEYSQWKNGESPESLGVETRSSVGERVAGRIRDIASQLDVNDCLLVVAHGAALSSATAVLLGMNPDEWAGIAGLDNCHWTLLRSMNTPPYWRILAHNRIIPTEREGELGVQGIGSIES